MPLAGIAVAAEQLACERDLAWKVDEFETSTERYWALPLCTVPCLAEEWFRQDQAQSSRAEPKVSGQVVRK